VKGVETEQHNYIEIATTILEQQEQEQEQQQ
jgi:hypothetical protein